MRQIFGKNTGSILDNKWRPITHSSLIITHSFGGLVWSINLVERSISIGQPLETLDNSLDLLIVVLLYCLINQEEHNCYTEGQYYISATNPAWKPW